MNRTLLGTTGLLVALVLFLLVNAFSPALFALIVDLVGWQNALYALLASSILTWICGKPPSRTWKNGCIGRSAGMAS